jgi:hypothetical protein
LKLEDENPVQPDAGEESRSFRRAPPRADDASLPRWPSAFGEMASALSRFVEDSARRFRRSRFGLYLCCSRFRLPALAQP